MKTSVIPRQPLRLLAILATLLASALSQSVCSSLADCDACITTAGCIWCSDPSYHSTLSRCFPTADDVSSSACSDSLMENPTNEIDHDELVLDNVNQVSLQSIDLRLRVGEPQSFNFSVRAAENFPLDLYILMDFSASFLDDLQTVQNIAPNLVTNLSNITDQLRVGFGAFVDKPAVPYASLLQIRGGMESETCDSLQTVGCAPTFSFQHIANFTDDQAIFSLAVNSAQISSTADAPEGTLDAMLQAIVCTEIIGWRADARKVLLIITDDLIHLAGDGAFAGINKPNDGVCRTALDPSTGKVLYQAALEYDYPSVEQVRLALIDYEIVAVVALAPLIYPENKGVIDAILNQLHAFAVALEDNSINIVDAIRNAYNQIVDQAVLRFNAPSFLSINVTPLCPEGSTKSGLACVGIHHNTVDFTMTLTLNDCVDQVINDTPYTLQVNVQGFDRFTVNVRGHCSCECNQPEYVQVNSTLCNSNGNLKCGLCECVEPFKGEVCDCDTTQDCPSFNEVECTGKSRGKCSQCGVCECANNFFGPACECSNIGCDCSGHGKCTNCVNGTIFCDCDSLYFGSNCQCTHEVCIDPNNPTAGQCYGNGDCTPCPPNSGCTCRGAHVGIFCNIMAETTSECSADQTCIECFGNAALHNVSVTEVSGCETANVSCPTYSAIDSVEDRESYNIPDTLGSTTECGLSSIQCDYVYYHAVSSVTGQVVYEVEPASCLLIPWWAIPVLVIGSLILIGLIILVVARIILQWMDYRELRTFRKEVLEADFTKHVNPAYQSPTATYKNPLHGHI